MKKAVNIFLVIILALNIIVIALQSNGEAEFTRNMPIALLQVKSGSMEPEIRTGDAILIRQKPFSELEAGDNIVFCRDDELIVHKVIETGTNSVITKGNANDGYDAPVSESEYCAQVLCRIPGLGAIWQFYTSVPLFIAWMLLLVLLLFGTDIFPYIYNRYTVKKTGSKSEEKKQE